MGKKRAIFIALLTTFLLVASGFVYLVYRDLQEAKIPHYEVGEQKGTQFCVQCHQKIYDQWSQNSSHALATVSEGFLNLRDKFMDISMYDAMLGEEMCYACHGSKEVNEGVNCETCHGTVIPGVSIEETHELKFTPGLEKLREPESCGQCHQLESMAGDLLMSVYSEWQESEAAANDTTCQDCHMEPREGGFAYHGFDAVTHNVEIYRDDLSIRDIKLDFPQFSLAIESHVMGHAIPASGPGKVLALEVSFLDQEEVEIYKIVETFAKKFELMPVLGLMPYELIENTQLQSGEVRPLSFTLPTSLEGQISKVVLTLRFYEVSDEHQGDIEKAHWASEPVLEQEFIWTSP